METYTFKLPHITLVATQEELLQAVILLQLIVNANRHNDPHNTATAIQQATNFIDRIKQEA